MSVQSLVYTSRSMYFPEGNFITKPWERTAEPHSIYCLTATFINMTSFVLTRLYSLTGPKRSSNKLLRCVQMTIIYFFDVFKCNSYSLHMLKIFKEYRTIVTCMPTHTTKMLQQLHFSVFSRLKSFISNEFNKLTRIKKNIDAFDVSNML